MNVPLHYVAIFENSNHKDWFEHVMKEELAELFKDDKLKVPGYSRLGAIIICACVLVGAQMRHGFQTWLQSMGRFY